MDELINIQKEVNPDDTILVIDSMMGQDAINVINGFNDKIKLSGVILTKLDGDTRGGVALSVKHLTNLPIKFIGVSEKMDGLTCSLRYINGELVSAETRGNGKIGEDIFHNIKTVKTVPQKIPYKDELIVDGEIICTYQDFEPFSTVYKNPRNFASGSIRLLDSNECAKRPLTFVAWNIIKGFDNENSFLRKLCLLYTSPSPRD